ncbi:MAG: hypothetical protein ABW213_13580 [Tardiphaga sp.]
MSEAVIILKNMRGGCATEGGKVHALFRVTDRKRPARQTDVDDLPSAGSDRASASATASS